MILISFATWWALKKHHLDAQLVTSTQSQQELLHIEETYPELVKCLRGGIVDSQQVESAASVLRDIAGRCNRNGVPQQRNQEIYFQCGMAVFNSTRLVLKTFHTRHAVTNFSNAYFFITESAYQTCGDKYAVVHL